jgi:hypothetical protein
LLVSKYFLASDFIHENELPPLLQAAENEGLRIHWLPVGDCLWKLTPIHNYQALWDASKPLNLMSEGERDQHLVEAVSQIAQASWTLRISLDAPKGIIEGRKVTISGKVEWKSPDGTPSDNVTGSLQEENIVLVPIVNTYGFGYYKQSTAVIQPDGSFETEVHCGLEAPIDKPQPFSIGVYAMSKKFRDSFPNPMKVAPRQAIASETYNITRTK